MSITNPEAIRYSNEVIRPLSEEMRSLVVKLEILQEAIDRIMPMIPDDASIVEDGRENEGVSRLTGSDVHGLVAIRDALLQLATPEAKALISKACVRPIQVN